MSKTKFVKCCICSTEIEDRLSHNPDPVAQYPKRCCADCNATVVIPTRLLPFKKPKK